MSLSTETEDKTLETEGSRVAVASEAISQKSYRPTPYRQTLWEIVGEVCKERDFVGMELPVIRDERINADPMFESFDVAGEGAGENGGTFYYGDSEIGEGTEESQASITEQELEALRAQHAEELQVAVAETYQRAKAEAEAEYSERLSAYGAQVSEFVESVGKEWQNLGERTEKQAVDLALRVAQKILRTTAEIKPDYILDVIRESLKHLGASKPLRIRVSPDDYEFLQVVGTPIDISSEELGVVYQIDEGMKAGCVIETDFGEIDFDIDRMWEQVKVSLSEVLK